MRGAKQLKEVWNANTTYIDTQHDSEAEAEEKGSPEIPVTAERESE